MRRKVGTSFEFDESLFDPVEYGQTVRFFCILFLIRYSTFSRIISIGTNKLIMIICLQFLEHRTRGYGTRLRNTKTNCERCTCKLYFFYLVIIQTIKELT